MAGNRSGPAGAPLSTVHGAILGRMPSSVFGICIRLLKLSPDLVTTTGPPIPDKLIYAGERRAASHQVRQAVQNRLNERSALARVRRRVQADARVSYQIGDHRLHLGVCLPSEVRIIGIE